MSYVLIPPSALRYVLLSGCIKKIEKWFTVLAGDAFENEMWRVKVWIVGESHVVEYFHKNTQTAFTELFVCVPLSKGFLQHVAVNHDVIVQETLIGDMDSVAAAGNDFVQRRFVDTSRKNAPYRHTFALEECVWENGKAKPRYFTSEMRRFDVICSDSPLLLLRSNFSKPHGAKFDADTVTVLYWENNVLVLETRHGFPDASIPTMVFTETRITTTS